MEIIFATGNKHKVSEVQQSLGRKSTLIMPKDMGITEEIPENGNTLEENAIEKCEYIWKKSGKACFADDTGLEVEALGGAPGVYTARYAGPGKDSAANMDKLLDALEGLPAGKRKARFRTVIALRDNEGLHLFEGSMDGTIGTEKKGSEGFGYDPIFIPGEYGGKTLAEITMDEKNKISHRGKAVAALKTYLLGHTL
ncbi:MAG: RdgB/HAM1 family non-canonical purine NTP pyrophosphatase [Bacteroidales bacterium]|jgi:XTP/dITP diphosphohydrolase|nr:RdgB/HAM1 family non-canonical purine NTP pyrophosphatase [Bacteroidales bacterium]